MIRKLTLLSLFTSTMLLAANTYAMHMNVILGDDIISNKDIISFTYATYYKDQHGKTTEESNSVMTADLATDKFQNFIHAMNGAWANENPTATNGEYTAFTFGYIKADGTKALPVSCQLIPAKIEMNITFNEAGCVIS